MPEKTQKRNFYNNSLYGFTLMELMISVFIVGMIAAFAIPNFRKSIQKARERNAALHLKTIYGANEIYKARSGGGYLPGAALNLAQINSGLSISIMDNEMTYSYTRTALDTYTATSAWTGGNNFTVRINQNPVGAANPCCSAGSCPSLPNC